jgi:hypothetical protein
MRSLSRNTRGRAAAVARRLPVGRVGTKYRLGNYNRFPDVVAPPDLSRDFCRGRSAEWHGLSSVLGPSTDEGPSYV